MKPCYHIRRSSRESGVEKRLAEAPYINRDGRTTQSGEFAEPQAEFPGNIRMEARQFQFPLLDSDSLNIGGSNP